MAMIQKTFAGIWTAIVTPFKSDGGIDWRAFDKLLSLQIEGGIQGVVVCGTTGESPTLSSEEKIELIKKARAWSGADYPIMAGTGGNCTRSSIELSTKALEAGANSLLVVTPPYNKPSFQGLYDHYSAICEASKAPVCLYHVPGRTAQKLTAEAIGKLTNIPGIACVKEASGEITLLNQCVLTSQVPILSGDDFSFLASLAVGAKGCISVASNVFPKEMVELQKLFENGKVRRAAELNALLFPIYESLFIETNPAPTKAMLSIMGHLDDTLRLPLTKVSKVSLEKIEGAYRQFIKNSYTKEG